MAKGLPKLLVSKNWDLYLYFFPTHILFARWCMLTNIEAWRYSLRLLILQQICLVCCSCLLFVPCLGFLLRVSLSTGQIGTHRSKRTLGIFWSQTITRGALRFVYFRLTGPQFSFSRKRGRPWTRWLPGHLPPHASPPLLQWLTDSFPHELSSPHLFPPMNSSHPYTMYQFFYFLN